MKDLNEILQEPLKRKDGQEIPRYEITTSTYSFYKTVEESAEEWQRSTAGIDNN